MRFLRLLSHPLLLLVAVAALARPAAAQTSIYGAISAADYGYTIPNTNTVYTHAETLGLTGGATWLFPAAGSVKTGIDARFDGSTGDHGGEAGLASFRIAYVPRHNPVSPYVQIGGGVVSTDRNTIPVDRRTGGVLALAIGLNVRVSDNVFIRPIEFMGTGGTVVGHATVGFGVGYTFHNHV